MKRFMFLIVFAGLLLPTAVWSLEVAFFDNPAYTDTAEESANLVAALEGLGHNVTIFSGITANDWSTATSAANLLVIPELDVGPLAEDLDGAALAAILGYVNGGGGFIGISSNRNDVGGFRDVNLWNAIFGFSLVHIAPIDPYTLQSIDPPFVDGPALLPDASAVEGLLTSSLPAGAQSIYIDSAGETVVSIVPVGSGMFAQVGFDWFTNPAPTEWDDVLGRTVSAVSGEFAPPAPVPSLSGFGMAAMIALFALFGTILTRRFV